MNYFMRFFCVFLITIVSINAQTDKKKRGELIRKYCQEDREEFCKTVKYGSIIKCLKENQDKISQSCKSILMSNKNNENQGKNELHKVRGEKIRQNCKNDREKFCNEAEYGNIIQCLKKHFKDLSTECKESLKKK